MTKYNYGKKMRKIVLGVTIIASLSTTACERSKNIYTNGSKSAKENVSEKTYHTMNDYGAQISVKDVKDKYNYQDETLMPLYNVEEDECFDFEISKSLASKIRNKYDLDVVTVHTDSKCLKESEIHIERTVS